MKVFQAIQKTPPRFKQQQARSNMFQGLSPPSGLDNFTVEQLTQIKNMISRKDNHELMHQVSNIIQS